MNKPYAFNDEIVVASTKWVGTVIAKREIGCCTNSLHAWVKQGRLKGEYILHGKREILRIEWESLLQFKKDNQGNRRIARPLRRQRRRRPIRSNGYVLIYNRDHPKAFSDGYVPEHVLVAEQMLGRPLVKGEVVHHKNSVRDDNRPENLEVFADRGLHLAIGHAEEVRQRGTALWKERGGVVDSRAKKTNGLPPAFPLLPPPSRP